MKLLTTYKLAILCGILSMAMAHGQTFNHDGYMTSEDSYTNKTAVHFFNGWDDTTYGDIDNPNYQTYLHWGQGKLSGASTGPDYFFVYVETPFEVKNMVWGNDVTPDEALQYDADMDYSKATGSEYISFFNADQKEILKTKLKDNDITFDKGDFGFIDVKSSVDYLFSKGATKDSSGDASVDAHTMGMAFEFRFALDGTENSALLDVLRNDGVIEYHLSPDRGVLPTQVPEPSSAILVMLSSVFLLRRKR